MRILWGGLLWLTLSSYAGAANLNCTEIEKFSDDDSAIDLCLKQANDTLNRNYEQLQKRYKTSREKSTALLNMQIAWLALREAQCDLAGYNAQTKNSLMRTAQRCVVKMTLKRAHELREMP
ncbi:lysozyme inhibitor LprI family protein [Thiofilum flexile]|uniref:lysozyme inhibitor LprI family protein n=1 Tax=Thiofilum flexile TaxID=125627 RepID=UPI0003800572|nr:lysozyme inhibitor LprI family protein [Thiofilum flexile]